MINNKQERVKVYVTSSGDYSLIETEDNMEIAEVNRHILELNKYNFGTVDELIENCLEIQKYSDELSQIGIEV